MLHRKICMLGAFAVGKSSLVRRYVDNVFSDIYSSTLGVRIDKKIVHVGETDVSLVLWDIHGEDSCQNALGAYIRGMEGYILVIDPTRAYSVDNASHLKSVVEKEVGPKPFVLVLNKNDIKEQWQMTEDYLPRWSNEALLVVEASAKNNTAVDTVFLKLAEGMLPNSTGTR